MKIKILALLLAMLMLLSLVACNDNSKNDSGETTAATDGTGAPSTGDTETTGTQKETDETTEEITTEAPVLEHLPTVNYGDVEFKLHMRPDDRYISAIVIENLGDKPTSVERAIYERMVYIEETYGLKFGVQRATDYKDSTISELSAAAKSEPDDIDLFGAHGFFVPWTLAINGCLYEWHDLELIDLDAAYWNQNAREQFSTPGGKLFFMVGDMSYLTVGTAFSMFFNKEILEDIPNLESPYELVRRDEWTFEMFEYYVTTADSNMNGDGSGTMETDSFGYMTAATRGPVCAIQSAGYPLLSRDDSSSVHYKANVKRDIVVQAVSDYIDLVLNSGSAYYFQTSEDKTPVHTAFINGQAAFYDDEVDYAGTWTKSGMSFGVLPWPKYSDDVDTYTSLVDAGNDSFGLLINTTEENAEKISIVLENLAYYGSRDVMPLYYETILSYQYLKDEDSIEMLGYIHETLSFDFGYYYGPGGLTGLPSNAVTDGSSSLSTLYSRIEGQVLSDLRDWCALDK